MERLAAEALGLVPHGIDGRDAFVWIDPDAEIWTPIGDGHQAMRLVRELHLHIDQRPGQQISVQSHDFSVMVYGDVKHPNGLQRAIVECAAEIRRRRHDTGSPKA